MTNEEKAYEISQSSSIEDGIWHYATAEIAAIIMAEWKDQQFKEYLEKKISEIVSARGRCPDDFEQGINYGKELAIKQIINELFKEE